MLSLRGTGAGAALVAALALCVETSVSLAAPSTAGRPGGTEEHFDILEYRVLGNSVLPIRAVEGAVYPFLGPNRDIDSVKGAQSALEKAYKDAGYGTVFVDIPEQQVGDDGVVRLRVTEGRLDGVRVKGARYFSGRRIMAALPALQVGRTPSLPLLQQQLAALNAQSAELSVTPILKAGPEPGTVDVDLAVRDVLPFHASVEADNQYTADTTPNRLAFSMSYDNLWQLNHSLSLQYQVAPADPQEAQVESATYLLRTQASPAVWSFSYVHTDSNVAALGTLGVLGKGSIYGVRWIEPIVNTTASSDTITLGVDYKDFGEDVKLASSPGLDTPIQYLNWTAAYTGAWRGTSRTVSLTTSASFGTRSLLNDPTQFEARRYGAPADYFYVRSSASLLQTLPFGTGLLLRLGGQWSETPLIDDEQFAIGGADTVRGYLVAEALGDDAATGSLELHSPVFGMQGSRWLQSLYVFGFGDLGGVGLQEPLPSQERWVHLASTGLGLRLDALSGLEGTFDYALPLVTGPYTHRGDGRVDFSVRYGF